MPAVFLTMLLVSCTQEVSFGVVDRAFLLCVTTLPIAVILFAPATRTPTARTPDPVPLRSRAGWTSPATSRCTPTRRPSAAGTCELLRALADGPAASVG